MNWVETVAVGVTLLATIGVGVVVHELAHAVVLRAFGVSVDVDWLPGRDTADGFGAGVRGTWASVTPRSVPQDRTWGIRAAALAPLAMALPVPLVLLGVLPDPVASGNPFLVALTVGWLACALPSPQDFSLFWYADRAIEAHSDA